MAKSSKRKRKARTPAKPYELTQRELAVGQEFLAKINKSLDSPRIKISKRDGVDKITYDHPMPMMAQFLLMEDLSITDLNFFDGLLNQLASFGLKGRGLDEVDLNFMLSLVKSVEPKDQVEVMLAAQMAAIHNAIMTCARRLAMAGSQSERAVNKRARVSKYFIGMDHT